MKTLFISLFACSLTLFSVAQESCDEYTNTLKLRCEKIVKTLEITDQSITEKVIQIMVEQYKNLGATHDNLKLKTSEVKASELDAQTKAGQITALNNEASAKLYELHCSFIGSLSAYLTNDQVEKVKDGMTFGVVQVTYNSYLDMIPSLKEQEKKQLYGWLVEAREHAMSAGSASEKHAWFGKYKGRFNNYLSQRGYDVQNERKAWQERLKECS